nr:MAG TPA: hypothetical protein [Caudoviricetes sp.]
MGFLSSGGYEYEAEGHGSNYTPPKRKKKRKK